MAALDSLEELNSILDQWNTENAAVGFATSDPVPQLKRYRSAVIFRSFQDPFDVDILL